MRKIFYFIIALTIVSCGASNEENKDGKPVGNTISGKIENGAGRTIYLEGFTMSGTFRIDSAVIGNDGSFKIKAPSKTDFYRLGFDQANYILLSLDSNDHTVKINAKADTLTTTYTVDGSKFSQDILEFVGEQTPYVTNRMKLINDFNSANNTDTSVTFPIQRSIIRLDKAFNAYCVNFVEQHPKSPATFLALSYLDPLLQLDIVKKVEKALAETMYNSPLHVDVLNKIGQLEAQKQITDAQTEEQERLMGHLQNGNPAPEINLPGTNGGTIALSSLKGKVVLIDFWASWCGPCRKENPNVVKAYNKYKDKGFTVYSVSLDKDKSLWLQAIQKDGLVWPNHVSDLKFWQSEAAQIYGVTSIPFTVLIGKDGKIIDKNLRGAALEQKLAELLGS